MKTRRVSLARRLGWCVAFVLAAVTAAAAPAAGRERLLLDFGWRFHVGDEWGIAQNLAKAGTGYGPAATTFSDASWRRIDLPHDWAVELPFDRQADGAHGFKAIGPGFAENSIGWYRRTFALPREDEGRRIWLEFDGAFRDATVFVNGWCVGRHESGYSSFRYDITDVANYGGKNTVAVKVDASQFEGWFYEGAGLYRHVWLVKTAPVAVAPDGVWVSTAFKDNVPVGPAEVRLQARLANATHATANVAVHWQVLGADGQVVAEAEEAGTVEPASTAEAEGTAAVDRPALWSPETPRLYTLVTTVTHDGAVVDRVETTFGFRTVAFDAEKGFLLNGEPYVLKGTCNHQDHAGVGAALPDALQYFRVARLKELGSNAYRTSHNPPTPELLEACDRLGLLVMDESRLLGSDAANLDRWEKLIRRDRNHPSVAIWSIANEEFTVQGTPAGRRVATTMQALAKRLDPTRPVTYAAPVGNEFTGINEVIEVRGWNYHIGEASMDAYHAAHPRQPNVGTEQGSTVGTRGIYANDAARGYVSAYDDNAQSWSNTAKQWWSFFAPRPWLSGGFVWTGFDYRGEPTPYGWPCINSHFGVFDTCGYPKDNFWYYRAQWTSAPVLHLLPHWNWAGREGEAIDVRAHSNCDEVELFLNGRSLGRQPMPRAGELKWSVAYAPGVLGAKGYRGGQVVAETKVETTGPAAAVKLTPDRPEIRADGEDVAVVAVAVTDGEGRVVPLAGQRVHFTLNGPGRIVGVGNGDPSSHEADVFVAKPRVRTRAIDDWRWREVADPYAVNLPETAEKVDDRPWTAMDVQAESGPLGLRGRGVVRGRLNVTAEELAADGVELWLGKIEGDAAVFVNGEKLGPGGDPKAPTVFDVKTKLHPGENSIAVAIATYGETGGVNKGVRLRLVDAPAVPQWERSVFNGLAQVLVRAGKQPGDLVLTATAEGLKPATVAIPARPAKLRPAVE